METNPSQPKGVSVAERYEVLVNAITDHAIIMLDDAGRVCSWNRGAENLSGLAANEAVGRDFDQLFASDICEAGLGSGMLMAATEHGRFESNVALGKADGTSFSARLVVEPLEGAQAGAGYAVTFRKLEQDSIASAGLEGVEQSYRRFVMNVTDYAIIMLNVDGRIASWNKGAELIKQYGADEIIGQHFSRFYSEQERAAGMPEAALAEARKKGHYHVDGWRVRKDGSQFWANVVIDPIHDETGRLLGYTKITRDITDRMRQQKSLEVAREELFQSQKLEAIGQLTGGVAHDFNNLLMVVMGSLEVIKRRLPDDPRSSRLVDNAYQAAQRGAQLTKRMLAFARKQELEQQAVDLAEMVRGMGDLLSRTLGQSIQVHTSFPITLPKVQTDPAQLDAALLNLAVNARDAMGTGGTIEFSATERRIGVGHPKLKPGHYVCLRVADEGEGMDEGTLARAIDPFFTTKGVGKGTGLGLPMVQGYAEQSGGMMQISSAKGAGTTVELWLQAVTEEEAVEAQKERPELPVLASKIRYKVLAVDDDALVLLNTSMMLEDLGHEVLEAHSAAEALQFLEDLDDIDMVITDHAMPRMTGVALAEIVAERWPNVPVALATGYADVEQARRMKLPRLAKPFTQNELERLILTITDRAAA